MATIWYFSRMTNRHLKQKIPAVLFIQPGFSIVIRHYSTIHFSIFRIFASKFTPILNIRRLPPVSKGSASYFSLIYRKVSSAVPSSLNSITLINQSSLINIEITVFPDFSKVLYANGIYLTTHTLLKFFKLQCNSMRTFLLKPPNLQLFLIHMFSGTHVEMQYRISVPFLLQCLYGQSLKQWFPSLEITVKGTGKQWFPKTSRTT